MSNQRKKSSNQRIDAFLFKFDTCDQKNSLPWTSSSGSEGSPFDGKSEILWSRDKRGSSNEQNFFRCFQDDFSDLTERTSSSCSWHNNDFDMSNSNQVQASIEAIEDALYDKQPSPLISKSVYQECCDWANKFPFLRLKGQQIAKTIDDGVIAYETSPENKYFSTKKGSFSLQVEGKKMAIHVPDKNLKKSFFENIPETENPSNYMEEVFDDDGEYEECLALDTGWDSMQGELVNNTPKNAFWDEAVIKTLHDKIVERIALEMWPKVVTQLQKGIGMETIDTSDGFQLPPIVTAVLEHPKIPLHRPKTEGTEFSISSDFPKLGSILSISPKVLQARDVGSWRGTSRFSRPNSEIPLHRKSQVSQALKNTNEEPKEGRIVLSHKDSEYVGLIGTKLVTKEENLFLPALDEDIQDPVSIFNHLYEPEPKKMNSPVKNLPMKSESFLPPIDGKSTVSSNAKLTQNLFSLFGPVKQEKSRRIGSAMRKPSTPASRPNTSASRKIMKYTGIQNQKNINERFSSVNSSHESTETASGKQVTLFPIVTSLIPCKVRNSSAIKKGFQNSLSAKKR